MNVIQTDSVAKVLTSQRGSQIVIVVWLFPAGAAARQANQPHLTIKPNYSIRIYGTLDGSK